MIALHGIGEVDEPADFLDVFEDITVC